MFLGIDQSLTAFGICLLDSNIYTATQFEPKKLSGGLRLKYLKDAFIDFIEDHEIVASCLEGYSYGSMGRSFELGEIGGVVKLVLTERDIKYTIVAPTQLKKFITGKSNWESKAGKVAVTRAANDQLSPVIPFHVPNDHNKAEAAILAWISQCLHTKECPSERHKLEVLHALGLPKNLNKKQATKSTRHLFAV